MSNSLGNVVTKYTEILDEIVTQETLTADLNMNQELLGEYRGNGKIEIPKLSMNGLGAYSADGGFPAGDITLQWEERTLSNKRAREFSIEAIADEERLGIVSMRAFSEFARTKVIPEVDAIRFAKLAANAGTKVSKTFSGSTAVDDAKAAIMAAEETIENNGFVISECLLYTTPAFKNLLRQACPHSWGNEAGPDTRIATFDGMKVVTVSPDRFYSAITLYDGTTGGQTDGGYIKDADTGKDINFLIVDPKACSALVKADEMRYFEPSVNQEKNAHKWQYLIYHDLLTFDNKVNGIYCSKKA